MNITQPPKLPFLEFLGWQIADVYRLTQLEMLASYERGWRHRHITDLPTSELAFIKQLAVDRKSGADIQPNETLVFVIDLIAIA